MASMCHGVGVHIAFPFLPPDGGFLVYHCPLPAGAVKFWRGKGVNFVETRLTNNADYLLCVLYSEYRQRRKNGELAGKEDEFGSSEDIQLKFMPDWPTYDIDKATFELDRQGLLSVFRADGVAYFCTLNSDGISYMERRFSDKFDKLTQRIATLRTILFG